jgi:glutamate-1-semialdehyde 2,1-aminomutase
VYQAGTLAGNPLTTAAGLAVLRRLGDGGVYDELERRAALLEDGLAPFGSVQRVGALLTLFMADGSVRNFEDAQQCDTERYGALFRHVLDQGIYLPPSQFEALFPSTTHGEDEIERTVAAVASFAG